VPGAPVGVQSKRSSGSTPVSPVDAPCVSSPLMPVVGCPVVTPGSLSLLVCALVLAVAVVPLLVVLSSVSLADPPVSVSPPSPQEARVSAQRLTVRSRCIGRVATGLMHRTRPMRREGPGRDDGRRHAGDAIT
jgi:hypothetical protein